MPMNSSAFVNGTSSMSLSQAEKDKKRHDAISSLMGQYLLKGWRMLNESCPACGTILFRQPNGELYCVGCSDIDNKAPPAYTPTKLADSDSTKRNHIQTGFFTLPGDGLEKAPSPKRTDVKQEDSYRSNESKRTTSLINLSELVPVAEFQKKIRWCSQRLLESVSPGDIRAWAEALKSLTDAVDSLYKCELFDTDLADKRSERPKRP